MTNNKEWLEQEVKKLSAKSGYIYDSNFDKLRYPNSAIQDFNKQIDYLNELITIAEEYKERCKGDE